MKRRFMFRLLIAITGCFLIVFSFIFWNNENSIGEFPEPVPAAYGLNEVLSRKGWREADDTRRGETWLSERLIFRDPNTGSTLWRMTCDPAIETHAYYDIPAWNADGSLILFNSSRASGGKWIMDGNGANLRPLPLPTDGRTGSAYWSVIDPLRMYFSYFANGKTHVAYLNPLTGKETIVVTYDDELGSMMPPHPSEKWFLFGTYSGEHSDSHSIVNLLSADGELEQIILEKRTHRLRFTTSPDRRIFFNFDDPRTTWTILPDGTERHEIKDSGSHPGWTKDGKELTIFSAVDLRAYSYDGSNKRIIASLGNGGHGTACYDGIWLYTDTYPLIRGNYPNCLLAIKLDDSETVLTIAKPYISMRKPFWHPQSHSTHPHPVPSPDGTKAIYNSDALSQYTDIYVMVVRPPDAPQNLKAEKKNGITVLSWDKPFRSMEIRGYFIYHADQSGTGYKRLTSTPVKDLSWKVPGNYTDGYYLVTSVEHSGLEGSPSNEVFGAGNENWKDFVRIMVEAETGIPSVPMREGIDPKNASNGWIMSVPEGVEAGKLKMEVLVPKHSDYFVWARVRGKGTARLQYANLNEMELNGFKTVWTWQRFEKQVSMEAGKHNLLFKGTGFDLDKILLTDDNSFKPEGMMTLDNTSPPTPERVKAKAVSPNAIMVSWNAPRGKDIDDISHYNVYCSFDKNFEAGQSTLLRSPSETEMVDWGLPLSSAKYYRVTSVDRSGNESMPSKALLAKVKPFKPVSIKLAPETARIDGMQIAPVAGNVKDGATTVLTVKGGEGSASWEFDVPQDGKYAIWVLSTHHEKPVGGTWSEIRLRDRSNESIFSISIDEDAITTRVKTFGPWDAWNWSPAGARVAGTPQRFDLNKGKHLIRFTSGTISSNIAQVMITTDPSWDPVEGMSLLGIMPEVSGGK